MQIAKTVWKKGIRTGPGGALLGGVGGFLDNARLFGGRNQAFGVGVVRGRHYNRAGNHEVRLFHFPYFQCRGNQVTVKSSIKSEAENQ